MGSCLSKLSTTEEELESPRGALKFPNPQINYCGHCESTATIVRSNNRLVHDRKILVPDSTTSTHSPTHAYWLLRKHRNSRFGQVWRALLLTREHEFVRVNDYWTATSISCAVKEYSMEEVKSSSLGHKHGGEDPRQEIAAMQHLVRFLDPTFPASTNHVNGDRNIVREAERIWNLMLDNNVLLPLDVFQERSFDGKPNCMYLITPFVGGGTMMERIQDSISDNQAGFDENETRQFVAQIITAIDNLHRAHICHFDLRLENILLSIQEDGILIPVVYGLGRCFRIPYANTSQRYHIKRQNYHGRQLYCIAPEILAKENYFDLQAADIWAIGPILYCLFTFDVRGPWEKATMENLKYYYFRNEYWDEWERRILLQWGGGRNIYTLKMVQFMASNNLTALLRGICQHLPNQRFSLEQIQQNGWMAP